MFTGLVIPVALAQILQFVPTLPNLPLKLLNKARAPPEPPGPTAPPDRSRRMPRPIRGARVRTRALSQTAYFFDHADLLQPVTAYPFC